MPPHGCLVGATGRVPETSLVPVRPGRPRDTLAVAKGRCTHSRCDPRQPPNPLINCPLVSNKAPWYGALQVSRNWPHVSTCRGARLDLAVRARTRHRPSQTAAPSIDTCAQQFTPLANRSSLLTYCANLERQKGGLDFASNQN